MNTELIKVLIPVLIETVNLVGTLKEIKDVDKMTLVEIKEMLQDIEWPELDFKKD